MKSLDVLVCRTCNSKVTLGDLSLEKLLQTSFRSVSEPKDLRQLHEMYVWKVNCQLSREIPAYVTII